MALERSRTPEEVLADAGRLALAETAELELWAGRVLNAGSLDEVWR